MARYWVFLNDEVSGPYTVEQLVRLRTFSRQTQVCVDDASGKPTNWMSPAEIPELAHIFKAVDERLMAPTPSASKPRPKQSMPARPVRIYTPAVTLKAPSKNTLSTWLWVAVITMLLGAGVYRWLQWTHRGDQSHDQEVVKALIETVRLPSTSPYGTLRHYLDEKRIQPRWEFERVQDAVYDATVSWYPSQALGGGSAVVYAFEANIQAQTVRGLNTAASKLLAEGFAAPQAAAAKTKSEPEHKETPEALFRQALDGRRAALEAGDFSAVWDLFSASKRAEMASAGISREGFIRVQGLTRRVDAAPQQTVLKTHVQSPTETLALIKQTQPQRPDIYIKQVWVFEKGAWKLNDEQKRSAPSSTTDASPGDSAPASQPETKPAVSPIALPGMSH